MSIDNGGPFHPNVYQLSPNGDVLMHEDAGASLRDVIAIHAMGKLIECASTPAYATTIAREAYKYADAMIAVSKEKIS